MVTSTADRELVITRVINAPRELVFEAWTKPEHLHNWWGPNGCITTTQEISVKVGGRWKFVMQTPDGTKYPNEIVFHEIDPPARLHYGHSGPGDPEGLNFITTVVFEEIAPGKTRCTMTGVFQSKEALEYVIREHGAKKGGEETIAKLATYIESFLNSNH